MRANAEELSVATFFVAMNKERYIGLADERRAIIDELRGEPAPMMEATSFDNEGRRGQDWQATNPETMKDVISVSVSADERARLDAVIADA